MTKFNKAYSLAEEWRKIQTKEKDMDDHSPRYLELEAIDSDFVLTDISTHVKEAVDWYSEGLKEGEEFTKEEIAKDKAYMDELINKLK